MVKKQSVSRSEFDTVVCTQHLLNTKVDDTRTRVDKIEAHLQASKERDIKQQEAIEKILSILNTSKGLVVLIKTLGLIGGSLTAIVYFFRDLKGWLK
ncbi:hypothetical protein PPA191_gp02 [Liberibacter phage P-PA19-1]|nr:hypothetical protein PPA191_gp02 [Liberibacter phage P-PA19-1]